MNTVFIRGISFDIAEKEVEEAFTEVGPVRKCFLVREKDAPKHRGFGFVVYALQEDAEKSVKELNGRALHGRKLQVLICGCEECLYF
jgi:nucleolar protein 4